jgi:hypothetical protein
MLKTKTKTRGFIKDLAIFLATEPTRAELLSYRAPKSVQRRANELLEKQNEGDLTYEERQELEEYGYAERLMRLIKARARATTPRRDTQEFR